jgi:hypothetical protein
MKRFNISHARKGQERRKRFMNGYLSILTIFALGLGSIVSAGCMAAPAVVFTSAAITATALVTEGEKAIQRPEMEGSYIARSDTDAGSGSATKCAPRGTLGEEDRIGAKENHEGWNQCAAGRHHSEAAPDSTLPQT